MALIPWLLLPLLGIGALAELAPTVRLEREAWAMGTRVRIVAEHDTREAALDASEAALTEIHRYDRLLSVWDPSSEISRLNQAPIGVPVRVSERLHRLLGDAESWSARTGRSFDHTVGPLLDAWDLQGTGRVPSDAEIETALRHSGAGAFWIDTRDVTVRRLAVGARIDTGAFGKGAALASVAERFEEGGAHRVLVDMGGQLLARSDDGTAWPVTVAHPRRRHEPVARLTIANGSVATSGASERWIEVGGVRLGHVLDPATGRPVPSWGSVTVVSADPVEADVLATALYVMGPERGMEWALDHEAAALFADDRGPGLVTTSSPAMDRWLDPDGEGPSR